MQPQQRSWRCAHWPKSCVSLPWPLATGQQEIFPGHLIVRRHQHVVLQRHTPMEFSSPHHHNPRWPVQSHLNSFPICVTGLRTVVVLPSWQSGSAVKGENGWRPADCAREGRPAIPRNRSLVRSGNSTLERHIVKTVHASRRRLRCPASRTVRSRSASETHKAS